MVSRRWTIPVLRLAMVKRGIRHTQRGDVFQIVLSRRFSRGFRGDDFNVYRALRCINPSPYLYYFDFGHFRIFGSSPETHLRVAGGKAYIDPIAGTAQETISGIRNWPVNYWKMRKKMPNISCWSTWHVMI